MPKAKRPARRKVRSKMQRKPMQELLMSFAILSIVSLPALAIGFTTTVDRTSELNPRMEKGRHAWSAKRFERTPAAAKVVIPAKSMLREKW